MNLAEKLQQDGTLVYTNVGVSMLPWIREGKDIIIIKKLDKEPKRYDAVLYRRDNIKGRGEYVLHRLMWKNKDNTYFIIGDNETFGERVRKDQVLGVLTHVVRNNNKIDVNSFGYKLKVILYWHFIFPLKYLKGCVNGVYVRLFK